jgi:thiol-disulfide isomerase/thioredoxin
MKPRLVLPDTSHSILGLALGLAVCAGVACASHRPPSELFPGLEVQPDGALAFRDAEDHLVVLDRPGKVYLVDFVVPGCKGCVLEGPELARLAHDLESPDRFQLVTVVYGWSGKDLLTIGDELNSGSLPLYGDTEGWGRKMRVAAWPTKLLVRDGRVLERMVGGGPGAYVKWRKIIEAELKARTVSAGGTPPSSRLDPAVVLHPVPGFLGNQRSGHDSGVDLSPGQVAARAVGARARLAREHQSRRARLHASRQLVHLARPRPDLAHERRRRDGSSCGAGDADRLLVHVQTDENGSTLGHG